MSNPFAIAAVTATLSQLLLAVREEPTLAGTTVTAGPPDKARPAASTGRQLNLYLYEVVPNPGWRNMDLPQRGPGGQLSARPVLALNLRYLVTAYGEGDDDLDAQHVLAHAMSIVHDHGGLTRDQVRDAIAAVPALAQSDLADQIELVKLTPYGGSLEDIARLWALYQSTNYRLSVGYEASVVLIERPVAVLEPQPPVREVELFTVQLRRPVLTSVSPRIAAPGDEVRLRGSRLLAERVKVGCDDRIVTPTTVSDSEVTFTVPADLPTGVVNLRVLHEQDHPLGTVSSNVVSLIVGVTT